MIHALILPPMPWGPYRKSFVPDTGPNPFKLYDELRKQDITCELWDPATRPWNPFGGMDTLLQSLDPLRALRAAVRQRRFDVIISVFEGGAAPLALLKSLGLLRTPVCLWDIGLTETWKLRRRILDITVPRIDAIMVLGSNQESYIRRSWNFPGKLFVINHHVDTEFFRPVSASPNGFVLSVGDDVGRDFETFIEAARATGREFVIKAKRAWPKFPDDANVRTVRERISYGALRDLYAQSSMVVVPTHETLNASGVSTILEASAMERPLVVSDNTAIKDFCIPGETCLMVPRQDPGAMRAAILKLLTEPETSARLARNAREFVVSNFSRPAFAKGLGAALKEICVQHHSI